MTWQLFVEQNYKPLLVIAKRWGKTHWAEMLSVYTIYLDANWDKVQKKWNQSLAQATDVERLKFSQNWMHNQSGYRKNGAWYKDVSINDFAEIWDYDFDDDSADELRITIGSEDCSEDIALWITDLHNSFSDEQVNLILMSKIAYSKLELRDKRLYDMYITDGMAMRAIATKLRIPLTSVYIEIKNLKIKLIEQCNLLRP